MEDNNVNVNEVGNETESGNSKLIAVVVGAGAAAFALGQAVGAKIGNPIDVVKRANAKHKIRKAERKLKKLKKQSEKLKAETEKLEVPAPEPVAEEAPKTEETK